jgi:LysR family transcriptional regulator for bpeEF and oprC
MRMGVLEHLGIARRQLGSSQQKSEKVLSSIFELRSNELYRSLRFDLLAPAVDQVRIFIEHLENTFALCSQFNPHR